eukprot:TRINITY_DN97198_c0_g1_i1.p2 TRINITY_DN97198_c0_g1~~TRINITY_DN97198_c0_g1_i1.p2  ORF type:complete len:114 (-),score=3.57 TRINITY_DN97198_c0_g1_i1:23-364(-)
MQVLREKQARQSRFTIQTQNGTYFQRDQKGKLQQVFQETLHLLGEARDLGNRARASGVRATPEATFFSSQHHLSITCHCTKQVVSIYSPPVPNDQFPHTLSTSFLRFLTDPIY